MQTTKTSAAESSPTQAECNIEKQSTLSAKKASFLKVDHVHHMPDFLMNLVSPQDQWMYITSNGALTAGRVNSDNQLFPYYTHDKLIDLEETTGSLTHIRIVKDNSETAQIWTPFSKDRTQFPFIDRVVYKSMEGNEVIFEETHRELELQFSYSWSYSPKFGFVRHSELRNLSKQSHTIRLVDGIHNLVPYGLDQEFLNRFSNLADAYKKSELITPDNLGLYYLSSIPTDRAEPSEGLKATVAWSLGYQPDQMLISDRQINDFLDGKPVSSESNARGIRGSYLVFKETILAPTNSFTGLIVADINQDAGQVEKLRSRLTNPDELKSSLITDIAAGHEAIAKKLSAADGYQATADSQRGARHLSNVLFNVMRGGVFFDNYLAPIADFISHLKSINTEVFTKFVEQFDDLPEQVSIATLKTIAAESSNPDLQRIIYEYLPLTFSRRHGDPSRPWNAFSIETTDSNGNPILAYQGNWRDIFQNWEALAYSYPEFIEGMIFRFLNASTLDGYNPYRLTKDGVDWEVLEPDEPWSNIGYWGDHQIIYLLKLLESSVRVDPERLTKSLNDSTFVFANVPYRISDFESTWEDPRNTVEFDEPTQQSVEALVSKLGADGKLVQTEDGSLLRASLLEKLIIPLLSKLSNFVPEGGIWMNTQRPEWNDANNALVGNGLSVVTLGYLHRYLGFLIQLLSNNDLPEEYQLSTATSQQMEKQAEILSRHAKYLERKLTDSERFQIVKALGQTGEDYRSQIYQPENLGDLQSTKRSQIMLFAKIAKSWIKHSLDANRRPDGLFHSYNLMRKSTESLALDHLYEMLEGQVSILSADYLKPNQVADLLDTLRESAIYRPDKGSYMLYPNRDLPGFLEKNIVAESDVERSPLIQYFLNQDDQRFVYRDPGGRCRFNGSLRNAGDLRQIWKSVIEDLPGQFRKSDFEDVESIFSSTFKHEAFTGRSGTFFAYEGLGSIYWHMVSKLVLAIQESYMKAKEESTKVETTSRLLKHYQETLKGLGIYQQPEEYGAFPSDAYSHTPTQSGAQQPGMTGQVKEDIIIRWNELGILIRDGKIRFQPQTLKRSEFLNTDYDFEYYSLEGNKELTPLKKGQLAFTFCQIPIVYQIADSCQLTIYKQDGSTISQESNELSLSSSQSLFSRSGEITLIEIDIPAGLLND